MLLLSLPGIYYPVSLGKQIPAVTTIGRNGVWHVMHGECHAPDKQTVEEMEDNVFNIQSECNDFILVELRSGDYINCILHVLHCEMYTFSYHIGTLICTFAFHMVQPT